MRRRHSTLHRHAPFTVLAATAALLVAAASHAAVTSYQADMDGPSEAPPNTSPGVGSAQVDIDPVAHTMRVRAYFVNLVGTTTAAHIHAPTAVAGTGTAGVATQLPSFVGFPLGVTSGAMDETYDMTLASSYNSSYITANGGTPATAEAALFQAIADGKAYFNVHTNVYPGGEIRGFFQLLDVTNAAQTSWGRIKSLYR